MTLRNPTETIIAQAITSAIDGALAKSQHERGLLRDFCETTARVFIQQKQQRTTQIFEVDGEDDVGESLGANRNHDQTQVHALEDSHNQVKDFVGAPLYDDYDDDFCMEPCQKSDVVTKEGDTSPQRKFLSLIDIHGINGDMTRETLVDRPIITSKVESYYVPVTNLTDEPIYDVSDYEVFIDSHYCINPLFNDEDAVQSFNNGRDFQVVVDDGNICARKEHITYGLGEKDFHQKFHRKPPERDRHKGHTYPDLVTTHNGVTNGSECLKLSDKTRHILKAHDQTDCFSELSFIQKRELENKITYLQEALTLEKEKNRSLEQELNETHKKIRMLNKGSTTLDKILSLGRTEKSTMGLGYQGDSSTSQTVFVRGKTSEQNNTRVNLNDEFGGSLECLEANGFLPTDYKFYMEPVYGTCKEDVQIQDESNGFDVQQRESIRFALSGCDIGVNKLDKRIAVSSPHDIVKLESIDKKSGHVWLTENSVHESFSFSFSDDITSEDEEATSFVLVSILRFMREENTLTTYHEQLLSWCNQKIMKPDTLKLVPLCFCSTFYRDVNRTRVVVLEMCVVSVFSLASVSLCWSFSWMIHTTRTLRRVAAVVQSKLLMFLITTNHCAIILPQTSIIREAWIWILPPPLVDDVSRRATEETKSKDARREEMQALAVMECLKFRARHVLVFPRFVVQFFLDVFGDILCFGLVSTVPKSSYQVFGPFILQRCSMGREKCNFGIICKLLLIKGHLGFYGHHRCARLVSSLSSLQSYLRCFAYVLHWSFSSQTWSLQVSSSYKDATIVCWRNVACVSSESLFGSVSDAAREFLYFAVFSFGCPLVDLPHLLNQKVQGFVCVVAFSPIHVSPREHCWILVIMDKVPCYYGLLVDRWNHTFSIILNIIVGGFVFLMEHSIQDVELQLVQVKKSISVAYDVRRLLFYRGIHMLFIIMEIKMFSIVRLPRSSLALDSVYSHIHLLPFISSLHKLHRGVLKRGFNVMLLMDLEFVVVILAARSGQVDVTVVLVQSPAFRVGPLALEIAPEFTRSNAHAKESQGSHGKLKARKIGPLEILENINANAFQLASPLFVHTTDILNIKSLVRLELDDALLSGFVDESLKGGGT